MLDWEEMTGLNQPLRPVGIVDVVDHYHKASKSGGDSVSVQP